MDLLLERCGVAEVGIDSEALLEGAAAGTSLSLPYCKYLVSAAATAVTLAADKSLEQPQRNMLSVFAETWHAVSLARLSDADLSNLWRLADYLMLDARCVRCMEDVAVQRRLRSAVTTQLLPSAGVGARANMRQTITVSRIGSRSWCSAIARGLAIPKNINELNEAARWGHWELIHQAHATGLKWGAPTLRRAASCGQLGLVKKLRQGGCPWGIVSTMLYWACFPDNEAVVIWMLENGLTLSGDLWLVLAAEQACMPVLQWACAHGLLPAEKKAKLRDAAEKRNQKEAVAWLDGLTDTELK
jgi:hypothetical protein